MIYEEVKQVMKTDKRKKYEYFIKKIADFEEVWALKDEEGWATLGKENSTFFPVWPKKEFADICITDEWADYYSESIELDDFLECWLQGLKEDGIRVTVMWYEGNGIDIDWDTLKIDIEE